MGNKQRSNVSHRPKITLDSIIAADNAMHIKMADILEKKGYGAWLSRHEILGIIVEEGQKEVVDAVHEGTEDELKQELMDLAIGCIFGVACIEQGTLDW